MIEILKYIGLAVIVFVALIVGFSILFRIQKARKKYKEKYTVLQVRVPKENESGPIVAEQVFATLHGIQHKFNFWEKLQGYSSDNVSFEIASIVLFLSKRRQRNPHSQKKGGFSNRPLQ